MHRLVRRSVGFSVLMLGVACGAQKGSDAKSGTNESSGDTAASSGSDTAESSAPAGSGEGASDGAKPSGEAGKSKFDPIKLCNGMCDSIAKKCGEAKEKVCRATCDDKYDVVPEDCAEKTKEAFECGKNAEDLLCSSFVPPSCSQNFDALAACATLGRDDRQTEYKAPVPSGWKRIEDKKAGFAVWMPPGATSADVPEGHAWTATDADGVEYRALVFKAPSGGNSDAVLKTAAGTFLKECTKGLKLRGKWEKGDEIGLAFGGKCKDGTGWRGVMRMTSGTIYALALHSKSDKDGAHDGFTYSFEYLKAK